MSGQFVTAIVFAVIAAVLWVAWFMTKPATKRQLDNEVQPSGPVEPDSAARQSEPSYRTRNKAGSANRREPDLEKILPRPIRTGLKVAASAFTAIVLILVFFSSATIVSTKNVGIVTSFGRPVGGLSNGFHMIAPWDRVTEMDAAIQTDNHVRDGSANNCITVRIAHQATACVDTSIRWRIEESASNDLFQNYRDFDNVRDSLVTRDMKAALNAVFETYDPLAVDEQGNSTSPSLESLSQKAAAKVSAEIGDQIKVLSVIVPVVHFDDNTQGKVNALLSQVAQTRIAEQSVTTAKQQALANATLAQSVSNDPNVLVSRCMDLLGEMVSKGQQIPVGFSCWPGGSSAVVVPGVAK